MKMKITGNGNTQVYLKQLTVIDKIFEAIGQQEVNEINLSEYSEKQLIRARRKVNPGTAENIARCNDPA